LNEIQVSALRSLMADDLALEPCGLPKFFSKPRGNVQLGTATDSAKAPELPASAETD
jgi:hypothetical protein